MTDYSPISLALSDSEWPGGLVLNAGVLNYISDLLTGYHPGTDGIDDFVSLVVSGSNTQLKIDLDGTGSGHSMTQIATLSGVTGLSVDALVASGELILSH